MPAAAGRAAAAEKDPDDGMLADSAAGAAGEGAAPKRRGRPKKAQAADAADADGEAAAPKPRGRKKKEPVAEAGGSGAAEAAEAAPAKKTRKKKVGEADAGGIINLKLAFDEGQARQQMVRVIGLPIGLLLYGTITMLARPLQLLPC